MALRLTEAGRKFLQGVRGSVGSPTGESKVRGAMPLLLDGKTAIHPVGFQCR